MKKLGSTLAALFLLVVASLTFGPALSALSYSPPWDHDPMGVGIGYPPGIMGAGAPPPPGTHPPDPHRRVRVDRLLSQIEVEDRTPIYVRTGNPTRTDERFRLECYVASPRNGNTLRLTRLQEGERGDYTVYEQDSPIRNGYAQFEVQFHHRLLAGRGRHPVCLRRVYLLTFKATGKDRDADDQCLQAVTVLSDDPACYPEQPSSDEK